MEQSDYSDSGHLAFIVTSRRKSGPDFNKSFCKDEAVQVFLEQEDAKKCLSKFEPVLIPYFEVRPVIVHIMPLDPGDEISTSDRLFLDCSAKGADPNKILRWSDDERAAYLDTGVEAS